ERDDETPFAARYLGKLLPENADLRESVLPFVLEDLKIRMPEEMAIYNDYVRKKQSQDDLNIADTAHKYGLDPARTALMKTQLTALEGVGAAMRALTAFGSRITGFRLHQAKFTGTRESFPSYLSSSLFK